MLASVALKSIISLIYRIVTYEILVKTLLSIDHVRPRRRWYWRVVVPAVEMQDKDHAASAVVHLYFLYRVKGKGLFCPGLNRWQNRRETKDNLRQERPISDRQVIQNDTPQSSLEELYQRLSSEKTEYCIHNYPVDIDDRWSESSYSVWRWPKV